LKHGIDYRLTLQKLEIFSLVAELGSITRAASQLFISQPVVTAHIRDLEEKLGATLIQREGRGIALTEAGQRVLKWAQGIITRTSELERELSGSDGKGPGKSLIAASMSAGTYLLPALLCDFYETHPEGLVQLIISTPQFALESVRSGSCDFAVIMLLPDQNLSNLIAQPLWNESLILVSAPDSRWVGERAERDELSKIPFVSTYSAVMRQLEEGQLRANGIASRRIVIELGHPEAQKEAVRRDLGVCFFLESSVQADLQRGDLRRIETQSLALSIPLYLVQREDKELSPYQSALKEHIEASRPHWVTAFADTAFAGAMPLTAFPADI
jgi:DNA-binding transcriptional LysR family regulator